MESKWVHGLVVREFPITDENKPSETERARMLITVKRKTDIVKGKYNGRVVATDEAAIVAPIGSYAPPVAYSTIFLAGRTLHPFEQANLYERRRISPTSVLYLTGKVVPLEVDCGKARKEVEESRDDLAEEALAECGDGSVVDNRSGIRQVVSDDSNILYSFIIVGRKKIHVYDSQGLDPNDIRAYVAKMFDVSGKNVASRARTKGVSMARQAVATILREVTPLSLSEIGAVVGGRDHTSVIYSIERVREAERIVEIPRPDISRLSPGDRVTVLAAHFKSVLTTKERLDRQGNLERRIAVA